MAQQREALIRNAPQHACEETDAWQAPSAGLAASHSADAETLRMHDWGERQVSRRCVRAGTQTAQLPRAQRATRGRTSATSADSATAKRHTAARRAGRT
jgi:hypothetical protein